MSTFIIATANNLDIKIQIKEKAGLHNYSYGFHRSSPRLVNYSVDKVVEQFDQLAPMNDTVGVKTGNKHIPIVRDSKSIKDVMLQGHEHLVSFESLGAIYPPRYHTNEDMTHEISANNNNLKFKLHCYETGGHFAKHSDGKKSSKHFATLLLFPPAHYSPFEGGDLILYPDNQEAAIVKTSELKHWTVVAFHIGIFHECTPITTGRRFVFKTEVELPNDNVFFSNTTPVAVSIPHPIEVNISNYEKKIRKAQERIRKYQEKIADVTAGRPTAKINTLISYIETEPGNVCLVLSTDNLSTDPNTLKGEEALLWNQIITKWPYSSLQIKDTSHCSRDSDSLDIEDDYDNNPCTELGTSTIVYWKSPATSELGKIIDTRSEYNDETYDTVHDLTVVLICIQKEKYNEKPYYYNNIRPGFHVPTIENQVTVSPPSCASTPTLLPCVVPPLIFIEEIVAKDDLNTESDEELCDFNYGMFG